jgi:uncharacterized protein (TIGR02266 family)
MNPNVVALRTPSTRASQASPSARPSASHVPAAFDRQATRVPLQIDVGVETESTFYVGFSGNISEGGLFIATHHLEPIGREIDLTLVLPDQERPLHLTGTVRWVREFSDTSDVPPGMGVRFEKISEIDLVAIQRYVVGKAPFFFDDELG